jgi:Flp pilus assembly protein TadG
MLEYALVMPILVGVIVGTVGLGRVLWCHQVLRGLTSDAARAGGTGIVPSRR